MIERIKHSRDGGGTKKGNGKWGGGRHRTKGKGGVGRGMEKKDIREIIIELKIKMRNKSAERK